MSLTTLAVCDTEPVAIEGLRSLMDANGGPSVISGETSLDEALDAIRGLSPSLVLVDRAFGSQSVMEWLRVLAREQVSTAAIVWGSPISESEAVRFLQAGARGVIRKTAALPMLMDCIRTVLSGSNWMAQDLLRNPARAPRTGRGALTARELQVVELVERGMKNREIGGSLGIQTGTVKIHLKHIFEKTGIHGRYGLALSGLKQKGLLVTETTISYS